MGKKVVRSIVLALIFAGTIVLGVGCAIALPALDPAKLEMPDTVTRIYDKDGKLATELQLDKGRPVDYDRLKPYVKQAIIATEDRQFYEHNGISYRSILRAIYRDILSGSKAEGASTITQQLARNAFLDQDKTFTRKIKEIALAAQIERQYTKDDILEMYMNKVNFHPSALGIEAAAQIYFNHSATDLTLGEAAFLAGLPQAPSYYYENLDEALKRRAIVLDNMVKEGYISQEEADKAKKEKVTTDYKKRDPSNLKYPHYVEYVLHEAEQRYKIPREQVMRGGLQIYTHLDVDAQQAVEAQFKNAANFPPNAPDNVRVESAMVLVDPKKGGIRALVGGRDPSSFLNLNRAFQIKRQPGSAIKPLIAYGPAVDMDPKTYNPSTLLNDKKGTSFGNPPYTPRDWDDHKQIPRGDQVTMREAIKWSFNIPAVQVLNDIGIDKGKKFAEKAGIPFHKNDVGLGIAIGGFEEGVSPLNMADAYQAFDNKGQRIEAHAIQKIVTPSGNVLAQATIAPVKVMNESTAQTITSLLQVVVREGTGTKAAISGRQVAGKTGTTEYGDMLGANRDSWFVGYTPEMVAAVWMGFDNPDNQHVLRDSRQMTASSYPAQLFSRVMSQALKKYPAGSFSAPPAEEKKEEPQTIQLTGEWNGKTVMLSWNKLKEDAVYYVFRVENIEHPEPGLPLLETKDLTTFVDTDVQPGKTYYYAISAVDPNNKSKQLAESNKIAVKTEKKQDPNDKDKSLDPTKPGIPGAGTGGGSVPGGTPGGIAPGGNSGTGGSPVGNSGGTGGLPGGAGGSGGGGTSGGNGAPPGGQTGGNSGGTPIVPGTGNTINR